MNTNFYHSELSFGNKALRVLWGLVWGCLFRFTPRFPGFWGWRRLILRIFGGKIGIGVRIYPSAHIWAPWNLVAGDYSMIGPCTDIYSVDKIVLEDNAWISQYSFLCTADHAIADLGRKLITQPIRIGREAWVAAGAYVGPGVVVGEGAVVAACACVVKDVEAWTVVGGNPARTLKKRNFQNLPGILDS